jgi:hypothetical protein
VLQVSVEVKRIGVEIFKLDPNGSVAQEEGKVLKPE